MSRWRPDARERLEHAAIELFTEQGFAATTVPQITARAGLTTRTFFRHFADKREVIFGGDEIPEFAARVIADAPAALNPVEVIVSGLRIVAETRFEGHRDEFRQRRAIVQSDEGLQERDLRKSAALATVIRQGFIGRGVGPRAAELLAQTCVTVLSVALQEWLDQDGDRKLFDIALDTLRCLQAALVPPPPDLTRAAAGSGSAGPRSRKRSVRERR